MHGCRPTSSSSSSSTSLNAEVRLHVYRAPNDYIFFGRARWYTSIQVYSKEYIYTWEKQGREDGIVSQIYRRKVSKSWARDCVVAYKGTDEVGYTRMTPDEVLRLVDGLGIRYRVDCYDAYRFNCNHFSDDLCRALTGKGISRKILGGGSACVVESILSTPITLGSLSILARKVDPEKYLIANLEGLNAESALQLIKDYEERDKDNKEDEDGEGSKEEGKGGKEEGEDKEREEEEGEEDKEEEGEGTAAAAAN